MRILVVACTMVLTSNAFAIERGSDIGIGFGQFSLIGDQAKGSGTGTFVRTNGFLHEESFTGAIGAEVGFGSVDNKGDNCCFPKDETLALDTFGINSALLWELATSVDAGFEIGVHQVNIREKDTIEANYGMTKLALLARFAFTEKWSALANFSYFLPVYEGDPEDLKRLGASMAYVSINYFVKDE